jgi:hypothetical protein
MTGGRLTDEDIRACYIETEVDPLGPAGEAIAAAPNGQAKKQPEKLMKNSVAHFSKAYIAWLKDPEWRDDYPPKIRLWHYLLYLSRYGKREVTLTNATVAEIGLTRQHKWRALKRLGVEGRVTLENSGNETVRVTVHFTEPDP